jgi:hypothetical protein
LRATNLEMVQRLTQSTCSGGVPNSGEHDFAIPVARVLVSSLCKIYGLPGELSEGLDRAEEGGKGLAMVVALGRLWRVPGRSPELWASSGELGVVRRRQRGRQPGSGAGFIAVARAWSRAAAGERGFVHGRALSAPPSVSPLRTRGSSLLPWFNDGFEHLSVRILAKPLCTVSFLLHILPFCCEFQAKIRSG